MNFWLLTFTYTFAFTRQISPLPLGCSYNGTTHSEGDVVRTEEPCLSCVCRKGMLGCSLRVCADAPDALPPGCFVLHKPDHCCPQIFCEEGFSENGVELRTAFKMADNVTGNSCLVNGNVYAEGSAIVSNRTCEYCYCIQGETKCVKPRCLRPVDGCRATYRQSSCCPTHYDCRHVDMDIFTSGMTNFAKFYSKVPNSSIRSLSSQEKTGTEEVAEEREWSATQEDRTTEEPTTTTTTTIESSIEVTTMTTETEPPTSTTEESFSFQTMKPENLVTESAAALVEGTTTPETETVEKKDVAIRSKVDFDDVILTNSSQDGDDYDAYDYSEPKLPPSLPNLVIFPFVAADAVVKDKSSEPPDSSDIKRIDTHPALYKDFFTPPIKTEGGFVPKEPSPSDLAFYKFPYVRKEQVELLQQEYVIQGTHGEGTDTGEVTPDPFDATLTRPTGNYSRPKKPVTVAYKNVIVDYFPYQLITTRGRYKSTTEGVNGVDASPTTLVVPAEDAFFRFPNDGEPSTTSESSFFDEFLKSLLSEEATTTTTTTAAPPTTKHKYSSKVKGSTEKPKLEDVTEKSGKPMMKEGMKRYTTEKGGGGVGALLKLAGCNIYGRMYRVGKVIVELSGPCLECVCTDLGVECRALDC